MGNITSLPELAITVSKPRMTQSRVNSRIGELFGISEKGVPIDIRALTAYSNYIKIA